MKSTSRINSLVCIATLLAGPCVLKATPSFADPILSPTIQALRMSLEHECEEVLKNFVPRLGYSGLAFATGTAGICTSYNGFKRLCNGVERNNRRSTWTGAAELSTGLGITAASIAIVYRLWH